MRIIHYSIFRALCAIAVGALLIKYREDMVEWMTIAIGVLFLISGITAMISSAVRKNTTNVQVQDGEGQPVETEKGISCLGITAGLGCMVLGLVLTCMPGTFVHFLVYIISAFLIIGAVQQFITLAVARRDAGVGFFYWIMPTLLFIAGLIALFKPDVFASAPLYFIGWFLITYGIVECVNALKARSNRKKAEKFFTLNEKPDFSDAEVVEAEEI